MTERLQEADYAANRLGISKALVWRLCRQGLLPHVRLGRAVKFCPLALEAWIAAGGQALPGGWRKEGRPA